MFSVFVILQPAQSVSSFEPHMSMLMSVSETGSELPG